MSTIEIKNVSKSYGKNKALDDVSLTLKENCIYGLLGRKIHAAEHCKQPYFCGFGGGNS